MRVRLLVAGIALTGLLAVMSHLTFGGPEQLPPVPVTAAAAPVATAAIPQGTIRVTASAVSAVPLVAQSMAAEGAEPTPEATEEIEMPIGPKDVEGIEYDQDLITISLDNAPLADVVRMFSRISGANIVAGTNLQGSVTVSMHDVPWEPALRSILDSVDLTLVEKTPGIYSILSKSELASEPVQLETVFLQYTSASNVLPIVDRMIISTNGAVSAFPSANAIVVQETADRLNAIRTTIRQIDKPRAQVYIETKFIELNDSAIETLGINWQTLQGYNVGIQPFWTYNRDKTTTRTFTDTSRDFDERNRTVRDSVLRRSNETRTTDNDSNFNDVIFDSEGQLAGEGIPNVTATLTGRNAIPSVTTEEDQFGNIREIVELGDVRPVRENTRAFNQNIESVRETDFSDVTTRQHIDSFERLRNVVNEDITTRLFSAVLTADELAVTLSALKEQDGVEVVSNPKIIVANGETARIHIGINEPNVTAVPSGDTGDRFVVTLDPNQPFIETGVKLNVTPTVNTEENITLDIEPELSRIITLREVGIVGITYPVTSIRTIKTQFSIGSGKTVAIGGLTETSDAKDRSRIPVLGDIPVIGKYLFSHKADSKSQDETIIFVTVGLANPENLVEITGIPSEGTLIHRHLANRAAAEMSELTE